MTAISTISERPDGRSRWERRRRTIVRDLVASLGRKATAREAILISNIAATTVRAEQIAAQIVTGEYVDDAELVRLGNVASRLISQLNKGAPKPLAPSLEQLLASRHTDTAQRSDKRTGGAL